MFTRETREQYDLESLWGVGAKFEASGESNVDANVLLLEDLISSQNNFLSDIEPLEEESEMLTNHLNDRSTNNFL